MLVRIDFFLEPEQHCFVSFNASCSMFLFVIVLITGSRLKTNGQMYFKQLIYCTEIIHRCFRLRIAR